MIGWVFLFVVLAFAGGGGSERVDDVLSGGGTTGDRGDGNRDGASRGGGGATLTGRVVRVVDGDTIKVRLDRPLRTETVRYIGVDTPESVKPGVPVQCFAKAADAFNRHLVESRRVRLRPGRERRDRYGRLLAYVYALGERPVFVNAALVRGGYARTLEISPNTDRAGLFAALERRAREAGRGLWRACEGY